MTTTPQVDLIAYTQFPREFDYESVEVDVDWEAFGVWKPEGTDYYAGNDPQQLIEFAGRACYQSWDRPNPKTAKNPDYIKHIIDVGHESVLEHASATFYIQWVSRALTHELIRHRHLSFSQLSQRFVDEADRTGPTGGYVIPPALADYEADSYELHEWHDASLRQYEDLVEVLRERGFSRKQAREAARAVLPNMIETKLVVTGNFRAWRHVIKLRSSPHADAEIRLLALELHRQLQGLAPAVFPDDLIEHEEGR